MLERERERKNLKLVTWVSFVLAEKGTMVLMS